MVVQKFILLFSDSSILFFIYPYSPFPVVKCFCKTACHFRWCPYLGGSASDPPAKIRTFRGSQFSMWPRKVQPTAWPDWSYRHPRWPGHAFYADMLADWVNQQCPDTNNWILHDTVDFSICHSRLSQLDTVAAAEPLLLPELRKPKDVTADEAQWRMSP